jgi:carboxymethylenebutenolidase
VTEQGRLDLTSADGTSFAGYQAVPGEPSGASMVVMPDVRGLHPYYEALVARFAEAGFLTAGLDYFGRTAGIGARGGDFEWKQQLDQTTPEQIQADVGATVDHLRQQSDGPVFTVGFCFGGSQSWRLAASDVPVAGCIGFYGRPVVVADVEAQLSKPMLLLVAGADAATLLPDSEAFAARLAAQGTPYTMKVYEGAPHSFFDRAYADWADACADAWGQILAFTGGLMGGER